MGRNRSANMRLLSLEAVRTLRRCQTPAEDRLWSALRNKKLDGWKFLRQYSVAVEVEGKESFFIADFFCAAGKLIVEVDGAVHDSRNEYDAVRDSLLEKMGYHVIRFSNDEVESDCESVIQQIKKILHERRIFTSVLPPTPLSS